MRKFILFLGMLVLPIIGSAQTTSFFSDRAVGVFPGFNHTTQLVPIQYGQVRVCNFPATGSPCSNPASITDINGNPLSIVGGNFGQLQTDVTGRFSFGAPPGTYQVQVAPSSSNTPQLNYPITVGMTTLLGQNILGGNNTWTGSNTFSGAVTAGSVNGQVVVSTLTDAGIQAAITAAPDGGEVYMPAGTYTLNGSLPITIAKRLTIRGAGWATVLQVASGVGATTDVFLLKPATASDVQGMNFQDFYITPQSGTPGRYAFNIDGTNASIAYAVFNHVRVDTLGNYALAVNNASGLTNGSPYTTTISNSLFSGGINLQNAGDTITIWGSTFTGPRDITVNQITGVSNGGAHGFSFHDNNVTTVGGIVIQNCWQGVLGPANDIESPNTNSTEANNALIDVQGAATKIQNLKIFGNYLGASNLFVADTVRVDRAINTLITQNFVAQGSGVTYRITANADRTYFGFNRQAPDNPISSFLADLGTNTAGDFFNQTSGMVSHYGIHSYSNVSGTIGVVISSTQVKANNANGLIGFSSGAPDATSLDSAFSRAAPDAIACGNGTFNDASCQLILNALSSNTANRANSGFVRRANADVICSRDSGNTSDHCFGEIQHIRGVAGCTTGAAAGNNCGTDITVTWPSAFADANYTLTCIGNTPTNVPSAPFIVSGTKLAATVHINYFAITAAAASYSSIDCIGVHD